MLESDEGIPGGRDPAPLLGVEELHLDVGVARSDRRSARTRAVS